MRLFRILIVIFGVTVCVTQGINPQNKAGQVYEKKGKIEDTKDEKVEASNHEKEKEPPIIILNGNNTKETVKTNESLLNNKQPTQSPNINDASVKSDNSSHFNLKMNKTMAEKTDELDPGAISRGILVFVALSFLFILYVGIKTCRRKSRDKRRTIVRKYGIRARRSDVEMEPLPLSDDDEDETVFDLVASRQNIN